MIKQYRTVHISDIPEIFDACNITIYEDDIYWSSFEDDKMYLDTIRDRIEKAISDMTPERHDELNQEYDFFDRDACASWFYRMFVGDHTIETVDSIDQKK